MLNRRFPHEATAFNAPVILRDRKRIRPRRFRDFDAFDRLAVSRDEMRVRAVAQEVPVEARFFADGSSPAFVRSREES